MHTMNMTRDAKGMRKMWRFQPQSFVSRMGKIFAARTREAMLYSKRLGQRYQPA